MCKETKDKIAIMQAYIAGSKIQSRVQRIDSEREYIDNPDPKWGWTQIDYRIKPDPIKYRNYLIKDLINQYKFCVISDQEQEVYNAENFPSFVKWLGDWQEVEV